MILKLVLFTFISLSTPLISDVLVEDSQIDSATRAMKQSGYVETVAALGVDRGKLSIWVVREGRLIINYAEDSGKIFRMLYHHKVPGPKTGEAAVLIVRSFDTVSGRMLVDTMNNEQKRRVEGNGPEDADVSIVGGITIDAVKELMRKNGNGEGVQIGHRSRVWSVGGGLLIVDFKAEIGGVIGISFFLNVQGGAASEPVVFKIASFSPDSGQMLLETKNMYQRRNQK